MRNTLLCCFFLLCSNLLHAQKGISLHLGYGTENNWGNTHFFAGLAFQKNLKNKFSYGINATGLTTDIYNANKGSEGRPPFETRRYNAFFLTAPFSYNIIGKNENFFKWKLNAGPSLKIYSYNLLTQWRTIIHSDGSREWPAEYLKYEKKKGISLNLFVSTDFTFKVNDNINAGVLLETYTGKIFIEHFMPGIKVDYKF